MFPIAGLALMTAGLALLSTIGPATPGPAVSAILVVFGAGFGMVGQVLTVAIQNGVEPRDIGVATGSANLFRALGGSIGVAVFGAIFAGRLDGSADADRLQAAGTLSPAPARRRRRRAADGVPHRRADRARRAARGARPARGPAAERAMMEA